MADTSQPLLRDFFSRVNLNEFCFQICSSDSTPALFITSVTKEEQEEYQKRRKNHNMRDLHNRHKVEEIAEGREDIERKVIKNHQDALNMLNRKEKKIKILAIPYPRLPTICIHLRKNKNRLEI